MWWRRLWALFVLAGSLMAITAYKFIPPGYASRDGTRAEFAGPWEYNGNLYGCFSNMSYFDVPPMPWGLNMYKSTDRGEKWAIVDPQNGDFWEDIDHDAVSFARIGNIIYMAWQSDYGLARWDQRQLRISMFDLEADEWTADISGGGPATAGRLTAYSNIGTTGHHYEHRMRAKANGTLYLVYCGGYNGNNWLVLNYTTYTPGTGWGTPATIKTELSRHHYPVNAVAVGNKIHVFSASTTTRIPTIVAPHLHHVTISEADTIQTYQTLSTDVSITTETYVSLPAADGNEIAISCLTGTAVDLLSTHTLFTADEAENPVWTTTNMEFPPLSPAGWYYTDKSANPQGAVVAAQIFVSGTLYSFVATIHEPPPDSYPDESTLWLQKRVGESWELSEIYTENQTLNPDNYYLIGTPQPAEVTGGIGLFFFSHDFDGDTERGVDIDEREYYGLVSAANLRFSYFGIPEAVTQAGNYGFFV